MLHCFFLVLLKGGVTINNPLHNLQALFSQSGIYPHRVDKESIASYTLSVQSNRNLSKTLFRFGFFLRCFAELFTHSFGFCWCLNKSTRSHCPADLRVSRPSGTAWWPACQSAAPGRRWSPFATGGQTSPSPPRSHLGDALPWPQECHLDSQRQDSQSKWKGEACWPEAVTRPAHCCSISLWITYMDSSLIDRRLYLLNQKWVD